MNKIRIHKRNMYNFQIQYQYQALTNIDKVQLKRYPKIASLDITVVKVNLNSYKNYNTKQIKQKCHQNLQQNNKNIMAYYQRDQLSIRTRAMLADYFAELILIAESIESFRTALAQTKYFNGIQLFRFLDKQEKGFLIPKDFAVLVSDEAKKILHYAFSWFDTSKAGQVTRIQFLQFLFPRQNLQLRQLIAFRLQQQYTLEEINSSLPMQVDLLRELIVQIMQKQTRLIPKRRILMDQQDYTLKAVMNCLDVQARGWISADDLYKFMKNYDVDVSLSNVCGLLGISDNDRNGKISMAELQWLVEGLQTSSSQYRNIVRNSDKKAKTIRSKSVCTCKNKGFHSSQKRNLQQKSSKKTRTGTKKQNHHNQMISFMQEQKFNKINKQIIDRKLNYKQQNTKSSKKGLKQRTKQIVNSNKKEKEKSGKKKKIKKDKTDTQYYQIKNALLNLEKQTIEIDEDLREFQQKLEIKTQLQMQRQLHNAKIRRSMKAQQKQVLVRRFQEIELMRRQEQIMRYKQQQQLRHKQEENKKLLQLQLQIQRKRVFELENERRKKQQHSRMRTLELQNIHLRQLQMKKMRENQIKKKLEKQHNQLLQIDRMRMRQYQLQETERKVNMMRKMQREEQSIKQRQLELKEAQLQMAINRKLQLQQAHLRQLERARMIQIENIRMKNQIQNQIYDHEVIVREQNAKRLVQTELDWQSQAKLRSLYKQEVLQKQLDQEKSKKQNEYFWKYRNYCNNLAQVADPLGIRQHLAQTDKYLIKSRQLRDLIKRDRTYSLNRYSNLKASKAQPPKTNTQQDEVIEKTPQNRKIIFDTIEKRTQQTNSLWTGT